MNLGKGQRPRLLFLGPRDAPELALIRGRLEREGAPRGFEVVAVGAERWGDLRTRIAAEVPTVLHVARAAGFDPSMLASGLGHGWETPECVVLHDAGPPGLVDELRRTIDVVIRVDGGLGAEGTPRFLAGFYCGVGMGLNYAEAFTLGTIEVDPVTPPGPGLLRLARREPSTNTGVFGFVLRPTVPEIEPPRTGPRPAIAPRPAPRPLPATGPRPFRVWYGTDRVPSVDDAGKLVGYSASRDDQLHVGHCDVEVPTSHRFGSIGSSWLRRFLTGADDRVTLREVVEHDAAAFWDAIRAILESRVKDDQTALVFVHGFRVSFEAAARQAAQVGFDLKVPGVMAFYSWPAQGRLLDYLTDEDSIRESTPFLRQFLDDFATRSGARRIDILAHSMGNRGLVHALGAIATAPAGSGRAAIGQVFHAAPDVDAGEFRRLAASYAAATARTTLYASPEDVAVGASRFLHRFARAGFTPPVTTVPGVDTVEVLDIDPTLLGHGYFAEAEPLLYDIHSLLSQDAPPNRRIHLEPADDGGVPFWRLGTAGARKVAANVRWSALAIVVVGVVAVVAGKLWGSAAVAVGLAALIVASLAPVLTARLVPRSFRTLVGSRWTPIAAWLGALGTSLWLLRPLMRRLLGVLLLVAVAPAAARAWCAVDPIDAALKKVDPARIGATVRRLAEFPTRHTLSDTNPEAAAWLRDEFRTLGYEDVKYHEFTIGKLTRRNVVCTKPGLNTDEYVIVCCHLDSRGQDLGDPPSRAPGADDDGSGVAAVLELARALKGVETPWSVRFVAFSGEEQGLVGSSAYAAMAKRRGMKIKLVLNLDMVGHPIDPAHPAILVERDEGNARRDNDARSAAVADRMERLAARAGVTAKRGVIYASDYMPFEGLGFTCVGLFDGADTRPFYHSRDDTPDKVDPAYCAAATRLALATLLDLAADR